MEFIEDLINTAPTPTTHISKDDSHDLLVSHNIDYPLLFNEEIETDPSQEQPKTQGRRDGSSSSDAGYASSSTLNGGSPIKKSFYPTSLGLINHNEYRHLKVSISDEGINESTCTTMGHVTTTIQETTDIKHTDNSTLTKVQTTVPITREENVLSTSMGASSLDDIEQSTILPYLDMDDVNASVSNILNKCCEASLVTCNGNGQSENGFLNGTSTPKHQQIIDNMNDIITPPPTPCKDRHASMSYTQSGFRCEGKHNNNNHNNTTRLSCSQLNEIGESNVAKNSNEKSSLELTKMDLANSNNILSYFNTPTNQDNNEKKHSSEQFGCCESFNNLHLLDINLSNSTLQNLNLTENKFLKEDAMMSNCTYRDSFENIQRFMVNLPSQLHPFDDYSGFSNDKIKREEIKNDNNSICTINSSLESHNNTLLTTSISTFSVDNIISDTALSPLSSSLAVTNKVLENYKDPTNNLVKANNYIHNQTNSNGVINSSGNNNASALMVFSDEELQQEQLLKHFTANSTANNNPEYQTLKDVEPQNKISSNLNDKNNISTKLLQRTSNLIKYFTETSNVNYTTADKNLSNTSLGDTSHINQKVDGTVNPKNFTVLNNLSKNKFYKMPINHQKMNTPFLSNAMHLNIPNQSSNLVDQIPISNNPAQINLGANSLKNKYHDFFASTNVKNLNNGFIGGYGYYSLNLAINPSPLPINNGSLVKNVKNLSIINNNNPNSININDNNFANLQYENSNNESSLMTPTNTNSATKQNLIQNHGQNLCLPRYLSNGPQFQSTGIGLNNSCDNFANPYNNLNNNSGGFVTNPYFSNSLANSSLVYGSQIITLGTGGSITARSRDQRRAESYKIPFSIDEIIYCPIDEFSDMLRKHNLTETQISLIRDIRRRGKNKVAAQNCRKRKIDGILDLERGVDRLQSVKVELLRENMNLEHELAQYHCKYEELSTQILSSMQSPNGQPYNSKEYTLQISNEGQLYVVPKSQSSSIERQRYQSQMIV